MSTTVTDAPTATAALPSLFPQDEPHRLAVIQRLCGNWNFVYLHFPNVSVSMPLSCTSASKGGVPGVVGSLNAVTLPCSCVGRSGSACGSASCLTRPCLPASLLNTLNPCTPAPLAFFCTFDKQIVRKRSEIQCQCNFIGNVSCKSNVVPLLAYTPAVLTRHCLC